MLFHRVDFFVFLAVVFCVYVLLEHKAQNRWLLLASYTFYSMWDWRFSGLMLLSTVVDFGAAWAIRAGRKSPRLWLSLSVCSNLGILGTFKYYDFFAESFAVALRALGLNVSPPFLNVILPVGISFYTFQSLGYTIDIYRGSANALVPQGRHPNFPAVLDAFADFALYVALFPQLVAGPIERSSRLIPQVCNPRRITPAGVSEGAWLFVLGLVMKVAIADPVGVQVDKVYSNPSAYDLLSLYVATVGFALQIYCDFAGYSNMARGVAALLGFRLMVNFRQPYLASSFSDFWRRWHISFSTWIRDYLYVSLGGNRRGRLRTYWNLMLAMLLSGLWHGATWAFVVWGGLHGLYLAVERALRSRRPVWLDSSLLRLGYGTLVFHGVLLGWVFFRVGDVAALWLHLQRLVVVDATRLATSIPVGVAELLPFFNFAFLLCAYEIPCRVSDRTLLGSDLGSWHRLTLYVFFAFALFSAGGQIDAPFIYFQF